MNRDEPIRLAHRLHLRLALFVVITIVAVFGLFSVYDLFTHRRTLTRLEIESSAELCATLTSSLEAAMLHRDIPAIQYSFEQIARREHIVRVFLLNTRGEVRASSEVQMIGTSLHREDEGCRGCHDNARSGTAPRAVVVDDDHTLRVVTPVENQPRCFGCHADTAHWNGLLVLDRSLQPVQAATLAHIRMAGGTAVFSVLLMMFLFRWYIKRQVINRVVYLESLARRVDGGELGLDISLRGQDELSSLARSFNNMKTTLKLSLDQLQNHRNYLTSLLEALRDGILIVDDRGCVAYVNRPFHNILNLEPTALPEGSTVDFGRSPVHALTRLGELIGESRRDGLPIQTRLRLADPSGADIHLEAHVDRLVLPPWLRSEVIVLLRDVTQRVLVESQVHQAEKLATVGRLAAGVAHEINNPMASILTCAEGLLERPHADRETGEYLQIIRDSAFRCKLITQKLLDYSAQSTFQRIPVDLMGVLREAVSLLHFEAARQNVQLRLHEPGALPVVTGSHAALVQVFVNLILNGLQAVQPGGTVDVVPSVGGDGITVRVNDDGAGITESDLPHVFDPFFTTKPVGQGTGLGLSVSRGIVQQHGGVLEIAESRPGFTSVRVSFPATGRVPVESVGP